jgi:hypothetical protein
MGLRRILLAAGVLIVAGPVAGCAAAGAATPARVVANPAASAPAYCASADKLKQSISALRSVDVVHGGLGAVQTSVTTIQANLSDFQAAATSEFGPDVTALRTSLSNLQTALTTAGGNVNASTLLTVVGDVSSVVNSYTTLQKTVKSRCG